jgi:RNA polymerase sigma-70 factor (ECF subfamily)
VVALYYFEDLPIRDIASILRLSEGGVKHALHRARQALAKTISTERVPHEDRA